MTHTIRLAESDDVFRVCGPDLECTTVFRSTEENCRRMLNWLRHGSAVSPRDAGTLSIGFGLDHLVIVESDNPAEPGIENLLYLEGICNAENDTVEQVRSYRRRYADSAWSETVTAFEQRLMIESVAGG